MKILKRGFTLIELLVVIAVLGVLVTVVILAIDPVQQLAKGRDAGRQSSVQQLGAATLSYSTSNGNVFPTLAQWMATPNQLVTSGELTGVPSAVNYSAIVYGGCTAANNVNGWCYKPGSTTVAPVVYYTLLEAKVNTAKCAGVGATAVAWALYSSADGRTGVVCTTATGTEPTVPAVGATEGVCSANPCTTANKFLQ